MKKKLGALAIATAAAVILVGCSTTSPPAEEGPAAEADITLWLMGGDTPDELRSYLKTEYAATNGGTLTIEEQSWGDALAKLTTALPDPENTPDVVEIGNTWAPTFTNVGAFSDLSDIYEELGGDSLLPSFVAIGEVDGKKMALPYYFGSRYVFYRKDIWEAAGKTVPTTLDEFNQTVADLRTDSMSGFYMGGQDWRNGIGWIFANGGELAVKKDGKWVSTLSDPNTVKGLEAFQTLFENASNAPVTESDSTPWVNINNNDATGAPEAATIIAPGWAHWSIGDLAPDPEDDTKMVATWNDDVFGVFPLPGNNGGPAPVFAGGSDIAISAASENQEAAKDLMRIIFSEDYQKMLGSKGLGPGNLDYVSSMGDDIFAKTAIAAASNSKLTPAAPGWAAVEGSGLLQEFFGKVSAGGDIASLAAEYDPKIDELLNG